MAEETKHLKLTLPGGSEFYNRPEVDNKNLEKIDKGVETIADGLTSHESDNQAHKALFDGKVDKTAMYMETHELTILQGFEPFEQKCTYSKGFDNRVVVHFKVKADTPLPVGRHNFAMLPEDCRPVESLAHNLAIQATSSSLHDGKGCPFWVWRENGLITVSITEVNTNVVTGSIVFDAKY